MTLGDQEAVAQAFEALPRLVGGDDDLVRRGRYLTCDFEVGVGNLPLLVSVAQGRVQSVVRGPFLLKPWVFAIRAEPDAWLRFLEPYPQPGFHDLMALTKAGRARVEGNLVPFMANLQYVKDLLAAPRGLKTEGARR
jgi:hypothetical protein